MQFRVQFGDIAQRDFWNQVAWLEENHSEQAAIKFEEQLNKVVKRLSTQPYMGSQLQRPTGLLRKTLISSSVLLFYQVLYEEELVVIITIRGAAEDWSNQPLS